LACVKRWVFNPALNCPRLKMVSEDVVEAHSRQLGLQRGNSVDQAVFLSKGQACHGVQPNEDVPGQRRQHHVFKTHHFLAKTQFTHQKVLFTHNLWPTPLPTYIVTPNPLCTSVPAPMYIYAHFLFRMLFLSIISNAYHLLSGSRAARLLLN